MKRRNASARREEQAAQNQGMRLRTRLLGAAMALLCFGVLAGRLYWLQVVQHDLYAQRAENQQLRQGKQDLAGLKPQRCFLLHTGD